MHKPPVHRLRLLIGLGAALFIAAGLRAQQGPPGGAAFSQPPEALRFRYVGPPSAGRFAAIAGIPGDTTDLLRGRGVRRCLEDHRRRPRPSSPIFDDQPVQAIGALAVAPLEPEHRLGGHRRGVGHPRRRRHGGRRSTSRPTPARRWTHMGLDGDRAASAASSSTPPTPTSSSPARWAATTGPQEERGRVSDHGRRRDLGAGALRGRGHRLLGPRRWTPTTPTCCSPAPGRW